MSIRAWAGRAAVLAAVAAVGCSDERKERQRERDELTARRYQLLAAEYQFLNGRDPSALTPEERAAIAPLGVARRDVERQLENLEWESQTASTTLP